MRTFLFSLPTKKLLILGSEWGPWLTFSSQGKRAIFYPWLISHSLTLRVTHWSSKLIASSKLRSSLYSVLLLSPCTIKDTSVVSKILDGRVCQFLFAGNYYSFHWQCSLVLMSCFASSYKQKLSFKNVPTSKIRTQDIRFKIPSHDLVWLHWSDWNLNAL